MVYDGDKEENEKIESEVERRAREGQEDLANKERELEEERELHRQHRSGEVTVGNDDEDDDHENDNNEDDDSA